MLDNSLFYVTAFLKLHIVSILFFWTDGQDGVEFLEFSRDPRAGLLLISHIIVSNSMAVGAQDASCPLSLGGEIVTPQDVAHRNLHSAVDF